MPYEVPVLDYLKMVNICVNESACKHLVDDKYKSCNQSVRRKYSITSLRVRKGNVVFGYTPTELAHPAFEKQRKSQHLLEIYMLKAVLSHYNNGVQLPTSIDVSNEEVYDYEAEWEPERKNDEDLSIAIKNLQGFNDNNSEWITASCPVHGGPGHSLTSLAINKKSGKWGCKSGCSNRDIYIRLKEMQVEYSEEATQ